MKKRRRICGRRRQQKEERECEYTSSRQERCKREIIESKVSAKERKEGCVQSRESVAEKRRSRIGWTRNRGTNPNIGWIDQKGHELWRLLNISASSLGARNTNDLQTLTPYCWH